MGATAAILVVDDDASIRLLCRVNLELEGFRVLEAESLTAAREAIEAEPVAVVVLDMHIGEERGTDLIAELKLERPELPVVMLTGTWEVDADTRRDVAAVLPKPFEPDELIGTVKRLSGSG